MARRLMFDLLFSNLDNVFRVNSTTENKVDIGTKVFDSNNDDLSHLALDNTTFNLKHRPKVKHQTKTLARTKESQYSR